MVQEEAHPFVTAMVDFLVEGGRRSVRPSIVHAMMTGTKAKFEADIRTLNALVEESGFWWIYTLVMS